MKSNHSLKVLDDQMKRNVEIVLSKNDLTSQNPRPYKLHPGSIAKGNFYIRVPRNFRFQRSLAICLWYCPDWLKFELILHFQLTQRYYSLDFENKGLEHSLELLLLSSTKDNMLKYCQMEEFFSKRELFGSILRDDLDRALKELKIEEIRYRNPKPTVRRKGYKDKGSRRPDHTRIEQFDFTFTEYQNTKEEKIKLLESTFHYLKKILEAWDPEF